MPRAPLPLLLAAASWAALVTAGCAPASEEKVPVDHRMGFLPEEMRRQPAADPADYVLHAPAWARIHRDSVCFVVDSPGRLSQLLVLDVVLRDPRTGDSLESGRTTLANFFRSRDVSCREVRFLGGRKPWQARVAVEMNLRNHPDSTLLASRKLVVDPDFDQLDLRPFPVRFFPDSVGMEWLLETSSSDAGSVRSIHRLVSWTVVPRDPEGFCLEDSALRLSYHSLDCPTVDSAAPETDLRRCSAALDSALAAVSREPEESFLCAYGNLVRLDSAVLANEEDGYGSALLFGKTRATRRDSSGDGDGLAWESRSAEGIGDYYSTIVDSATGVRLEARIPAVRWPEE